jgi:gliding motility-associated-like protein
MEKISETGIYELRVKEKDLECYSDPILVEVLIRDMALVANFDFVVKGTNIKGDTEGGIFPDDILQFTAVPDEEMVSWKWSFGDGTTDDTQNPTHIYGKKGSFEVELLARNKLGCEVKVKKTISITRSFRLMIPNAFTPTLAENTTFLPKQKGLTQWEIMIFNTWGDLIFQTTELDTSGWDGKIEDRLQDAGVYIYRVNGQATDGEKVSKTGKLNLIR